MANDENDENASIDWCKPQKKKIYPYIQRICKPQKEDCEEENTWLKKVKPVYKCPWDKHTYNTYPDPPLPEFNSRCPPGPYRDPIPKKCKKICKCIESDDGLEWRGNPKDFCFKYINRYRLLRHPRKNPRCIALAEKAAALREAERKAAEAACEKARLAAVAAAAAAVAPLDCTTLPKYPIYEFTECQCADCRLKRLIENAKKLICKKPKIKIVEYVPGCGPPNPFPCNTYYNPRRRNKCACTCECAIRNKLV